jgi:hypothetical protein
VAEQNQPPQQQDPPGRTGDMRPNPRDEQEPVDTGDAHRLLSHQGRRQPDELAPSYVFFAAGPLSSYYTGEVLAALGGETTPG